MTVTSSASPTTGLLGNDLLGSAIQKLSASRLRRITYTSFGHAANLQSGSVGFTGQVKEPGTAQYMLGNGYRGYSPTLMRFTAPDEISPFGKGGLNSYGYCHAQPITLSDPSGQFAIPRALLGALGFIGVPITIFGAVLHQEHPSDTSRALMIGGALLFAGGIGGAAYKTFQGSSAASRRAFITAPSYRPAGRLPNRTSSVVAALNPPSPRVTRLRANPNVYTTGPSSSIELQSLGNSRIPDTGVRHRSPTDPLPDLPN
jgi:RHS repeat-associated protein